MEVIVNKDIKDFDEFIKELKLQEFITDDTIFVNKILNQDGTINLELLELEVKYIISVSDIIKLSGFDKYFTLRGIIFNYNRMEEESRFITEMVNKLSKEFCEENKDIIVLIKL
jgi:hypothetical protein